MPENRERSKPKALLPILSLRTQLVLILLFLLLLSVTSLTIIYERSEGLIMEKFADNMNDITKAIQISVEELAYRGDSTQRLGSYVAMLNKKGIKEITVIGDDSQVIASSDPKKVGTKPDNHVEAFSFSVEKFIDVIRVMLSIAIKKHQDISVCGTRTRFNRGAISE